MYKNVYTFIVPRATAKVFKSGNSQAVRLPKSFRLAEDEVYIQRIGEALLLIPKGAPAAQVWQAWYESLGELDEGFRLERDQPTKADERPW